MIIKLSARDIEEKAVKTQSKSSEIYNFRIANLHNIVKTE